MHHNDDDWQPVFAGRGDGSWLITNIRYPSGACGYIAPAGRNKWRIVADPTNRTFRNRLAAARAEFAWASQISAATSSGLPPADS